MDGHGHTPQSGVHRLLLPISEQAPGGRDPRLGDRFDRIYAEIGKLAGVTETPDWQLVVDESEALLEREAKDLRIGAYLTLAWYQRDSMPGLARGFELLAGLLQAYWEDSFPPPAKLSTRSQALSWLCERLQKDLGAAVKTADLPDLRAAWLAFVDYRATAQARFGDRPPTTGPIEQTFEALPADVKAEVLKPAPGSETNGVPEERGLVHPISASNPAGDDPRLGDEFEQLRVEIEKLQSPSGAEVDWPKVLQLSQTILIHQSKDLRCLAYWVVARTKVEGVVGMVAALASFADCIERFAEGLHPRREKARAGALAWLGQRFQAELSAANLGATPAQLEGMRECLTGAQTALTPHCEDLSGLFLASEALGRLTIVAAPEGTNGGGTNAGVAAATGTADAPAEATDPTTAASATSQAEAAASSAPSPTAQQSAVAQQPPAAQPATATSTTGPGVGLEQALLAAAQKACAAGKETANSLRLRRLARWMQLPELGPGNRFDIELGVAWTRDEFTALVASEDWAGLLSRCERTFEEKPMWLDLTYWSILAARKILEPDAAAALTGEFVALLLRHPGIEQWADRQAQSIASREVRKWIAQELLPSLAPAPPPAAPSPAAPEPTATPEPEPASEPAPTPESATVELPAQFVAQLDSKAFDEALATAAQWTALVRGRSHFVRTMKVAQHCLQTGAGHLAYPLFRGLEQKLRTAVPLDWDPELAIQCIRGYLSCAQTLGLDPTPEHERLVAELALLDPTSVTEFAR